MHPRIAVAATLALVALTTAACGSSADEQADRQASVMPTQACVRNDSPDQPINVQFTVKHHESGTGMVAPGAMACADGYVSGGHDVVGTVRVEVTENDETVTRGYDIGASNSWLFAPQFEVVHAGSKSGVCDGLREGEVRVFDDGYRRFTVSRENDSEFKNFTFAVSPSSGKQGMEQTCGGLPGTP